MFDVPPITAGDTRHAFRDLYAPDGVPVDVTGWTIKLRIRKVKAGTVVVRDAEVDSERVGGLKYQPVLADVNEDTLLMQWKLTDLQGLQDSVPNGDQIRMRILPGVPAA